MAVTRARRVALLAVLALVAMAPFGPVILAGLTSSDTSLEVSNHSGTAWYLTVDSDSGMHWVVKVGDGAAGLALAWHGGADRPVRVLDLSCNVVGTLERQADGTFAAAAVSGLTATIEGHGPGLFPRWSDRATYTHDCGGDFYG